MIDVKEILKKPFMQVAAGGVIVALGLYILASLLQVTIIFAPNSFVARILNLPGTPRTPAEVDAALEQAVLPDEGVELPVQWGDLGMQLISTGVIDKKAFSDLYAQRGELSPEDMMMFNGNPAGRIRITPQNANLLLNLFWALGLGNKNEILDRGPMMDKKYGGDAGRFASTGGWTLAKGNPMNHYSHHAFITLTPPQQDMITRVSKGIYRPCCGNPVHFPDCNHGMAMLGLLELMASQGVSEEDMYKVALTVNSYWFPDTYLTIAKYLQMKGVDWDDTDPAEVLGVNFSSAQGYQQILEQVQPAGNGGGSSCGV